MTNPLPLKAKYRLPGRLLHREKIDPIPEGTWVYNAGRFSSGKNNSGKAQKPVQGLGNRRRQGWGCVIH